MKHISIKKLCNLHSGGGHANPEELTEPKMFVKKIKVNDIIDTQSEENNEEENINENVKTDDTKLPWSDVSRVTLYTIPEGIALYHGSQTVNTFDVKTLKLNKETSVVFFSPNIEIAKSYIQDCSPTNPTGFIHKFVTTKPIEKIYIISSNETSNVWEENIIEKKFCNNEDHDTCRANLHGIGFFVDKNDTFNSEFALCKPLEFLEYKGRAHCNGARVITNEFEN